MLSSLARRTAAPAVRKQLSAISTRTYVTAQVKTRDEVSAAVNKLHDSLIGSNWGDYLQLVNNVPFWEVELEKLGHFMTPYMADAEMGPKWEYTLRAMDVMYCCEDARDHINELLELKTRAGGVMNMGVNAHDDIENLDEQVAMVKEQYNWLLKTYPDFQPKIEMAVGHGLAAMRQKHKFEFKSQHLFFY